MTIQERILQYIDYKGVTPYKFCKDLSFSMGYLDKRGAIGTDKYLKIIEYYTDVNPEWLLTGNGSMLKNKTISTAYETDTISEYSFPLVSVEAVGGFGGSSFAIEKQDVKAFYTIPKFQGRKIDFMIEVAGASMYPKYNSGDVVACTIIHESNFIQWNKVHVIATKEQGILIKRLKKSENGGVMAISDNKDYDPFEIPNDEITGIALVVGVIRLE